MRTYLQGTRIELDWTVLDLDRQPIPPTTYRVLARLGSPSADPVEITDHEIHGTTIIASWLPPQPGIWIAELEVTDPFELVIRSPDKIQITPR